MRLVILFLTWSVMSNVPCATGHVFVTNERGDSVSVIDAATNTVIKTVPVGRRPRGIGLSPDGKEIYIAASGDNAIVVLDPNSLSVVRSFQSGNDPETFAVHSNGNILNRF